MHYYTFNIGDYQSHTSHLDELEDIAYRRMIDWLYLHEKPLPESSEDIARIIRMRTHNERITNVLKEFFILQKDGYTHCRVLKEIKKYKNKSVKAKNSAKARWAIQGKASLGDANALRTQSERNANHKPITNNQEPIKDKDISPTEIVDAEASTTTLDRVPYQKIIDLYHEILPELRPVIKINSTRQSHIRQRWKQDLPNLEEWRKYFEHVRRSSFLMGKVQPSNGRKSFVAGIDFLINGTNAINIAEGKYHG
jgi:uncharacterized protein YdaU (DUF1376 family)